MDKLAEIKENLNVIYKEYKDNKSLLNGEKTRMAANLIVKMTLSENANPSDVAAELARFSAGVVSIYFESLTKSVSIPLEVLDEILKELYSTDKDSKLSQHYVQKYIFAVTAIIKNYKDKSSKSTQLPRLVVFIAKFAIKSDKHKSKFQTLINNTMAGIFMLDYSNISKNSLVNVWNATKAIYPDLSKAKYESIITEWGEKYGFIPSTKTEGTTSTDKKMKIEESAVIKEPSQKEASVVTQPPTKKENVNPASSKEEPKVAVNEKNLTQVLYERLKRDMDKEQEAIISAFTDKITSIGKAFESIQGEINKSRSVGAENLSLKAKIADLEKQLSEQKAKVQTANQSLATSKTEIEELKKQISSLKSQNSELDNKLNDAYAINSRESSLEAEKIRSELKKAFTFLYEDWLEYEFSDVSKENYESLQAIIKKIFRSLERNGIDFKGNN